MHSKLKPENSQIKVYSSTSLGFVSIATNKYLDFWFDLANSIENKYVGNEKIGLTLMTDDPKRAENWIKTNISIPVTLVEIPSYRWPEATLYRYELMEKHSMQLDQDILVYIDADSLINFNFTIKDFSLKDGEFIALVQHPGFWRPKSLLKFYFRRPVKAMKDLIRRINLGGIGAWETSRISTSYVPRKLRKTYYCGGIWFGSRAKFLDLCEELSNMVKIDEEISYIAKWHDESHLNNWATKNEHLSLPPEYCYAIEFEHLHSLQNKITAVKKY